MEDEDGRERVSAIDCHKSLSLFVIIYHLHTARGFSKSILFASPASSRPTSYRLISVSTWLPSQRSSNAIADYCTLTPIHPIFIIVVCLRSKRHNSDLFARLTACCGKLLWMRFFHARQYRYTLSIILQGTCAPDLLDLCVSLGIFSLCSALLKCKLQHEHESELP